MENEKAAASSNMAAIRAEMDELKAAHRELEMRLDELNGHVYLTPAEQVEEQRIKKLKLQKKDRIHELEHLLGDARH